MKPPTMAKSTRQKEPWVSEVMNVLLVAQKDVERILLQIQRENTDESCSVPRPRDVAWQAVDADAHSDALLPGIPAATAPIIHPIASEEKVWRTSLEIGGHDESVVELGGHSILPNFQPQLLENIADQHGVTPREQTRWEENSQPRELTSGSGGRNMSIEQTRSKTSASIAMRVKQGSKANLRKHYLGEIEGSRLRKFVNSPWFDSASFFSICMSVCMVGWQTSRDANELRRMASEGEIRLNLFGYDLVVEILVCFFFSVEVLMRFLGTDGIREYFCEADASWNLFDAFLLFLALADLSVTIVVQNIESGQHSPLANLMVLRTLRTFRLARSMRVIRTSLYFKDLRLMIASLTGCFKPLFWVVTVLFFLIYMFAISFTEAAMSHLSTVESWGRDENKELIQLFGSLSRSMVSLFQAMSGGDDWSVFYNAIGVAGDVWQVVFILFIALQLFAVVNVVTGIFVQSAVEMAMSDKEAHVCERLRAKKEAEIEVSRFFLAVDGDDSGTLEKEEFVKFMQNKRAKAFFEEMGIDHAEAEQLFDIMDVDAGGTLSRGEFVLGVLNLHGSGSAFNQAIMMKKIGDILVTLEKLAHKAGFTEQQIRAAQDAAGANKVLLAS